MKKRNMKKRVLSLLCTGAMVCGLAACTGNDGKAEYANQTLAGQVVSVEDDTLTLLLGEITEQEPQAPENDDPEITRPSESGENEPSENKPGENQAGENKEMPEPPEGQAPSDENNSEQPPQIPSEDRPSDSDQAMPDGMNAPGRTSFTAGDDTVEFSVAEEEQDALADLDVNDVVQVEIDENGTVTSIELVSPEMGGAPSGQPGGFGGSNEVTQGTAANTISTDGTYTGETYTSTGDDENALRVDGTADGAAVTLENITVDKASGASSNTEDGDFYGQNAALLVTNGATATIKNATITSSAQNGNGVFSYGEGTTVNISNSVITTTADNSGGIQTTGGGTTNATELTVETSGNSSAAIRSDRGGGTVNVNGGTYTSNGYNSPAVYSTAAITVKNATLTANNSEALVIEGQNSITLEDCEVSGNMSDTQGSSSDENVHNVMIYQSMSGDAEVGTSSFSMTGGTLTSNNGDLFYVTNTNCVLSLSDVEIVNHESDGYLLLVSGNSASHGWGTAGANGAQVTFTANGQTMEGDIAVDTISTLNLTLTGKSSFTGTVNIIENAQNGTAVEDNAVVTVEKGSTWTLTGDCTLTSLENNGTINFNGYTITLADGTVLNG